MTKPKRRLPVLTAESADAGAALHEAAVRLLARREHSARELAVKLIQRGFDEAAVSAEISRLAEAGLQSDRRFAEIFAEQRVARGDGPLKIAAALARRGVDGAMRDEILAGYRDEWIDRAGDTMVRRFGAGRPEDRRGWERRVRFLQTRGYPAEVVRRVLGIDADMGG